MYKMGQKFVSPKYEQIKVIMFCTVYKVRKVCGLREEDHFLKVFKNSYKMGKTWYPQNLNKSKYSCFGLPVYKV